MNDVATPVDPDRTIVPAHAGLAVSASVPVDVQALPAGTRLDEFEITGLVGRGGFGIVYRALDHSLGRMVALKEYLPSQFALRSGAGTVLASSPSYSEAFATGRRSFVNEARTLARFDHPSLVRVHRFWEANGTAYMAMPLIEGPTLRQWLEHRPPPDESWLVGVLTQLLAALDRMHAVACYHRDVAPDNIIITRGDRPVLLDFGAARRVVADATQAITVIVKPGFAPWEQYAMSDDLRQGPWTDLYALAATAYFAITGAAPPPAIARLARDRIEPLMRVARHRYSPNFLATIDHALAVMPGDRPQSAAAMIRLLGDAPTPGPAASAPTRRNPGREVHAPSPALPAPPGVSWIRTVARSMAAQIPLTFLRLGAAALVLYLTAVAVQFVVEVVAEPSALRAAPPANGAGLSVPR